MNFTTFLNITENYDKDLKITLNKIPASHRKIISPFKFIFQPGNELNGDGNHIGVIDNEKKTITVAAPWRYGREYTVLHEIGHLIYSLLLTDELKKKWAKISKDTPMKAKDRQGAEELFCMAYASYYVANKIDKFVHHTWEKFVKNLPH